MNSRNHLISNIERPVRSLLSNPRPKPGERPEADCSVIDILINRQRTDRRIDAIDESRGIGLNDEDYLGITTSYRYTCMADTVTWKPVPVLPSDVSIPLLACSSRQPICHNSHSY